MRNDAFWGGLARAAALVISTAASPFIVLAVTAALVVMRLHASPSQLLLWAAICIGCGAVVPFLVVFGLWRGGRVGDVHVARREQRLAPLVAALVSTAGGVVWLYAARAPQQLVALGCVYLVVGAALTIVSLRWKISMHNAVLTTGVVALGLIGYANAWYGLLAVPLVLWARVYRQKHTLAQGLAPALLGVVLTPLVYWAAVALIPAP